MIKIRISINDNLKVIQFLLTGAEAEDEAGGDACEDSQPQRIQGKYHKRCSPYAPRHPRDQKESEGSEDLIKK